MEEKKIHLQPDQKYFFWWFLAGILLIPLLGLGIYIIYKKKQEIAAIRYEITDHTITVTDQNYVQSIDLVNIKHIDVKKRWIDEQFDLGTLEIQTDSRSVQMKGIQNSDKFAELIMQAAEAERVRMNEMNRMKKKPRDTKPEAIDKMDYLTGLWQQGLISNEDFKKEKKHFDP